jgi:hypothetical protein
MTLPTTDVQQAKKILAAANYWKEERSYKSAVHTVIAALLAPSSLADPQFPQRLANVFGEPNPDYAALGISPEQSQDIDKQLAESSVTKFRAAMANLAGGKWGLAQFLWIPRAVKFELGEELRAAFQTLMSEELSLAERVDGFREQLYATQVLLKERGGFQANWNLIAISMNFVAMLLGGYDPENYIFYAYGKLRKAFTDFGAEWPKGSAGHKYTVVCDFAKDVGQALAAAGVKVKDLIDVQGFLWVRGEPGKPSPPSNGDNNKPPRRPKPSVDLEQAAKDLAAETYWPVERARKLVHMTDRWGQLLFQGPPGTGKTHVAKLLANLLGGEEEGRSATVQFHPSYAYEDFVEGIRPKVTSDEKALLYEVRPGIFLQLVNRARKYSEERFFLIIDEMNRANVPRVLGELLFALEYRGDKGSVELPYSGAKMWVPENIKIIGTMNSADRSIALVDAAVRRRFRHVDFSPDPEAARSWLKDHDNAEIADEAAERLSKLNATLRGVLDIDRLIGHSYLMRDDLTAVGFESVWDEDIEPVLREHLYNQPEELGRIRGVFLG